MASINTGNKAQSAKAESQPANNASSAQTGGTDVNFAQVSGAMGFLRNQSGKLSNLLSQFNELQKSSEVLKRYHASIMVNPNLPGGEVLLLALKLNNKLYVSSVFSGDADWDRGYAIGGGQMGRGQEYGSVRTTPAEVVTRRIQQQNGTTFMPYRADLFEHYAKMGGVLDADAKEDSLVATGVFTVYEGQDVDVARLVGFADFDTRSIICTTGLRDSEAAELVSSMGSKLTVSTVSHTAAVDGLGAPVFAPVIVQINRQSSNQYRGGMGGSVGTERVGEIRGYIDILPMNREQAHQLRVKRAAERGVSIDAVQVPVVKPIFVVTGVEWLAPRPFPTSEAVLFLMDAVSCLGENPQWLRKVIDAPTVGSSSSDYDVGAIGYLAEQEKTNVYRSDDLRDDAVLMKHILEFWDSISVAVDVPKSGPYRTALELMTQQSQVNRLLNNTFGQNAILLQNSPVVASLSNLPVGIYRDTNGVLRDSRDATNMISWLNRMGGAPETVQGWLNDWVAQIGSTDEVYAKRLRLIEVLVTNGSFELRNEVTRVVLNSELFSILRKNSANAGIEVSGRVVTAAATTDYGYAGGWGDGIQHQNAQGPAMNQQFQNIPTYY